MPEDPVPGQTVYDVIDYTYVVTPTSQDDAGTYLSLLNIDPAYEGSYVFQVFVTKPLTSFMTDKDDACSAFDWTEGALVGHISDPTNPRKIAVYPEMDNASSVTVIGDLVFVTDSSRGVFILSVIK